MSTTNNQLPEVLQPPDDICIPLEIPNDQDYLWLVAKALKLLTQKRFWFDQFPADVETVRKEFEARVYLPFVDKIIERQFCGELTESGCMEYPPHANFITYEPSPYPFTGGIPAGYLQPPFFVFDEILPSLIPDFIEDWLIDASGWTGYLPTDIITAAWCFPFVANWFNEFASGLPRFQVNVTGAGEVELHLLSVPIGSRAIVAVDVEPNIGDIIGGILSGDIVVVETELDLSSYPPEQYNTVIHEVILPTLGDHTIHVVFVPSLNADILPLQFGGGLRKIVLCGGVTPTAGLDTLPCEVEMNDTIRVVRTTNQSIAANVLVPINWGTQVLGSESWHIGDLNLMSGDLTKIEWQGDENAHFHVQATVHLTLGAATNWAVRLVDQDGTILAQVLNLGSTQAQLNIDTDVYLEPNDWLQVQVLIAAGGTVTTVTFNPSFAVHRIDKLGATGPAGTTGNTGSSGTIPPAFQTTLINAMNSDTQDFLDDLVSQYTSAPQDIDANIPVGDPDATEEVALCQALMAWMNLYCETKAAQIRSRNQIQQAWDALNSAIFDAFQGVENVFGWSITDTIFACFVDSSTALLALDDQDARETAVCCLYDSLKDINLTTGSFDGAISGCIASLSSGDAHDILCMIEQDNNLEHDLMFFYLYGRALTGGVSSPCPCGSGFSYLEYDFTVNDNGFSAQNGDTFYVSGQYWDAADSNPDPDNWSKNCHIGIALPATARVCGIGINFDANRSCGITTNGVFLFNAAAEVAAGGSSPGFVGTNLFRTWSFGNNEIGVIGDEIRIRLLEKTCSAGNEAIAHIIKVRVWFALNSVYHATPSTIAPQFLPSNGTSDSVWWQS